MVGRLPVAFVLLSGIAAAADQDADQDDQASVLAVAQRAKIAADEKAEAALNDLKQYANRTRDNVDQAALVLRIEDRVREENVHQVAAAESEYQNKNAALRKLTEKVAAHLAPASQTEAALSQQLQADRSNEEKVDRAAEAAREAAQQLSQARKAERRAMRQHVDELQRASKAQVRQLGKAAKAAAHEALRAAARLMRAQREAGVSEERAEGDYGRAENFYDDFGEDLRGRADDRIENFYQGVQQRVEMRMDALADEAERKRHEQRRSIDSMRDTAGLGRAVRNLEHRLRAADRMRASGAGSAVVSAAQLAAPYQSTSAPAAALLGFVAFGVGCSAVIALGRRQTEIQEAPLLG